MAEYDNELGLLNYDIGKRFGLPQMIAGSTGLERTKGFVNIRLQGIEEMFQALVGVADKMGATQTLERIVKKAARPIYDHYKNLAEMHEATGNLAASTRIRTKSYDRAVVAIVGPEQTGRSASTTDRPSGNHAWLVEYGSQPRRPGTHGRRTYVNVHTAINGHMARHSAMADVDFAKKAAGYYFLMSSFNERTRQARRGSGYTHDFMPDEGRGIHPMTLHPGETYGGMPALHLMERTITAQADSVRRLLEDGLRSAIANAPRSQTA